MSALGETCGKEALNWVVPLLNHHKTICTHKYRISFLCLGICNLLTERTVLEYLSSLHDPKLFEAILSAKVLDFCALTVPNISAC